jgi:uncharacterized protein YraI
MRELLDPREKAKRARRRAAVPACLTVLVVLGLGCNLPSGVASRAAFVAPAEEGSIRITLPASTRAPEQAATATVTETATPTVTPTQTASPPMFTSSVDANCRWGPGLVYGAVGSVPIGTTVRMTGRSADSTWWYVENVASPGSACWVSATTGTVMGDVASLPVVAAPPTPEVPPTLTPTPTSTLGIIIRPPIVTRLPLIPMVTSVSVNAIETSYSGPCPHRMYWYGSITTNMATTVKYEWESSSGGGPFSASGVWTLVFSTGGTLSTDSHWMESPTSSTYKARIHVREPNSLYSNEVTITLNCE